MGRKTALSSLKRMSEINLTPLMDLTFILLITFIITFPLIEQGIAVDLPSGSADELSASRSRTITVDRDGRFYLDDLPVSLDDLEAQMQALGSSNPDSTIMVRADRAVRYGVVVEVLKVLHGAKLTKMALVTQEDGG